MTTQCPLPPKLAVGVGYRACALSLFVCCLADFLVALQYVLDFYGQHADIAAALLMAPRDIAPIPSSVLNTMNAGNYWMYGVLALQAVNESLGRGGIQEADQSQSTVISIVCKPCE